MKWEGTRSHSSHGETWPLQRKTEGWDWTPLKCKRRDLRWGIWQSWLLKKRKSGSWWPRSLHWKVQRWDLIRRKEDAGRVHKSFFFVQISRLRDPQPCKIFWEDGDINLLVSIKFNFQERQLPRHLTIDQVVWLYTWNTNMPDKHQASGSSQISCQQEDQATG